MGLPNLTFVGVAAALLVGLLALPKASQSAGSSEPSPTPTLSATPTVRPSPTPSPTARPTATPQYRLPLVPVASETPSPRATAVSPETPQIVRPTATPSASPIEGRFDSDVRDFLAIGMQNGEPIAILLARLEPPTLSVAAIPCEAFAAQTTETEQLTSASRESKNAAARRLAEQIEDRFGLVLSHTFTADVACLDALLDAVPTLSGGGLTFDEATVNAVLSSTGEARAYGMGAFGAGLCRFFSTVSPWKLPALREATRGKVDTELNLWELLGFAAALRSLKTASVVVLPTETVGTEVTLSPAADAVLRSMFR